jgi:hypothetical protein
MHYGVLVLFAYFIMSFYKAIRSWLGDLIDMIPWAVETEAPHTALVLPCVTAKKYS